MSAGRPFWLCFLMASFAVSGWAGEKKREPKNAGKGTASFQIKVPVNAVLVNAIVSDKHGQPVTDLRAEDFRLFEDGKAVQIQTFSVESYGLAEKGSRQNQQPDRSSAVEETAGNQIRRIIFFIDDLTLAAPEFLMYTQGAIEAYLAKSFGTDTQLSIQNASGKLFVSFTHDSQTLRQTASSIVMRSNAAQTVRSSCPDLTDRQASRIYEGVDDGRSFQVAVEETIDCMSLREVPTGRQIAETAVRNQAAQQFEVTRLRNRALLGSLKQALRTLRHVEGQKQMFLLSDGLLSDELQPEMQRAIDAALLSGVIVNTVDVTGLRAQTLKAEHRGPAVAGPSALLILAQKPSLEAENAMLQSASLRQLSAETGGKHIGDNNDLAGEIRRMLNGQYVYYVLTYSPPSAQMDGRYHKIRMEVSRPGVALNYRKGYYATREQTSFEQRRKEDIVEALQIPSGLNEIPIQLSYSYYQVAENRLQAGVMIRANLRKVRFEEQDSRFHNVLKVVVAALDRNQRVIDGVHKTIEFNLTGPGYQNLLEQGFSSKADLNLPAGRYTIKAVLMESLQEKTGSIERRIELP